MAEIEKYDQRTNQLVVQVGGACFAYVGPDAHRICIDIKTPVYAQDRVYRDRWGHTYVQA